MIWINAERRKDVFSTCAFFKLRNVSRHQSRRLLHPYLRNADGPAHDVRNLRWHGRNELWGNRKFDSHQDHEGMV